VLAELLAVLHLTQEGLGMPCLEAIGAIADEDIWRISPTAPLGVMVDDLDRLLFVKFNVSIKI